MTESTSEQSLKGRGLGWLREQHARRFIVEKEGRVAVDLPLTVFVVGAVMAPHVAILGIVLAFVTRHEVHVESPDEGLLSGGVGAGESAAEEPGPEEVAGEPDSEP